MQPSTDIKRLKLYATFLSLLIVGTLAVATVIGSAAGGRINTVQGDLDRFHAGVETKGRHLAQIRSAFGYGGFIHKFKNFVLRQNDRLVSVIEGDIRTLRAATGEAGKRPHARVVLAPDRRSFLGYTPVGMGAEGDALRPSGTGLMFFQRDVSRSKAAARRHVLGPALYSASALGALAVLFWLGSHFIVARRLARLLEAAEKLASGDLTARGGLEGGDRE